MTTTSPKIDFNTPVQYLKGVGPVSAKKLARLGVETVGDLLWFFPRKYLDYSDVETIAQLLNCSIVKNNNRTIGQSDSELCTIRVRIVGIGNKTTRRRGFNITEAIVEDGTGTLKVVWFNQPYLAKMLPAGREVILHGKITWDHINQMQVMESPDWAWKPKIVPVYPETEGIRSGYLSRLISNVKLQISKVEEFLSVEIIEKNGLMGIREAIIALHQPANMAELERARQRMAFDELFLISLRGQVLKQDLKNDIAFPLKTQIGELVSSLPYQLTEDQQKAWRDIASDIARDKPMNRLLNGDVGSGKTVVATMAAYAAVKADYSVLIMAPTEILANQHYKTFKKILPEAVKIELVTSSTQKLKKSPLDDEPKILVGTQALLFLPQIYNIALVIVDEQHRFGVKQRQALKGLMANKKVPHFLSMTATPIPRSLQLVLFGELDVSVIQEKPAGRREIKTRVVDEIHRQKAYDFIRAHVQAGRQVFVICPLIKMTDSLQMYELNESTNGVQNPKSQTPNNNLTIEQFNNQTLFEVDRKTVVSEYEKLSKKVFPDLRIGMLHGKMKSKEKDEIMGQFASVKLDILVSTSVVEVGVDIANASIMMVEDAERFGLAQLHQFRGRVGRAEHQSFCFLFSNSENSKTMERIKMMERVADGFKLAEYDLKNRGAGDIFGLEQSGFMDIKFADLSDISLISKASDAAKTIVARDPKLLKYARIKEKLGKFIASKHLE